MQNLIWTNGDYNEVKEYIVDNNISTLMIVGDRGLKQDFIRRLIIELEQRENVKTICFTNYVPNPDFSSVVEGVHLFKKNGCNGILAVGGGSAIDVSKCIKIFATAPNSIYYLSWDIVPNTIPFIAIPTTAGSGSEATKFAVVYKDGIKLSIEDDSAIPSLVILNPSLLNSLPYYQKKVTMLDALCHAIESFWSINANEESRNYSNEAITLITENYEGYLDGKYDAYEAILNAANIAGKAINITKTTAGHAMAYKLTGLYGLPHGHAVSLCVLEVWKYMQDKLPLLNGMNISIDAYEKILRELEMSYPKSNTVSNDIKILVETVNEGRLKNNPIKLSDSTIYRMYSNIIKDTTLIRRNIKS